MKKYISLFIVICLCLALTSCNIPKEIEATSTLPPDDVFPYEIDENGDPKIPVLWGDWTLHTHAAFMAFLTHCRQPDDFITYENIQMLGHFDYFRCHNAKDNYNYSDYSYSFIDDCAHSFSLHIYHLDRYERSFVENEYAKVTVDDFYDGNLLAPKEKIIDDLMSKKIYNLVLRTDNVEYYFDSFGLIKVCWQSEDVYYELFSSDFQLEHRDYTILSRISNLATSLETISVIAEPTPITIVRKPPAETKEGQIQVQE